MWSPLATVVSWLESRLDVRVGSYPPANQTGDYLLVNRVGGDVNYPHDHPRISVQVWTDSDTNGEQVVYALSSILGELVDFDGRINGVETEATVTQLGPDDNGHFVWQLTFTMHCRLD